MSIFGAPDTPVSDFWWRVLWDSKQEWAALFALDGGVRDVRKKLDVRGKSAEQSQAKNLQKLLLSRALCIHFWSLKTWDQRTVADLRDHVSQVLYNYVTKDFSTKTAIEISRFLPPIYPFSGSAILCTCVCGGRGEFNCSSKFFNSRMIFVKLRNGCLGMHVHSSQAMNVFKRCERNVLFLAGLKMFVGWG